MFRRHCRWLWWASADEPDSCISPSSGAEWAQPPCGRPRTWHDKIFNTKQKYLIQSKNILSKQKYFIQSKNILYKAQLLYTKHWLCIVTRVTPSQSYGEIPGFMAYLFRQLFLNRQNIFSWEDCLKENIFLFYVSRISMKWNIAKHKHKQMYRISTWTFIEYETHFRIN